VVLRPVLFWLSQGFGLINSLISWLLAPLGGLLSLLFRRSKRTQPTVDV
jgi:hypothetical protein